MYVTKTKKIVDNQAIALQVCQDMFSEFLIARDLDHPNIVKYINFLTKEQDKLCEFNIILEYIEGGNLKQVIANQVKFNEIFLKSTFK